MASVVADTSRIVSLSGDLTEIIFELDLGDSVVGVDITTVYPEEAASLPVVGIGRFLTAEGVLAQQPTLVIGDTQTDPLTAIEQIRAAGVPVVILEIPTTFEGLYDKMRRIGDVLDVPDAARRLTDRVKGEVDAALAIAADADLKRMAYVYTRGPDVLLLFGEGMVSNPLIEGAAGIDAGAESGIEGTIPVTAEALVAAAPEVIIVPEEGYGILGGLDAFLALPGVAQTPVAESAPRKGPLVAESIYAQPLHHGDKQRAQEGIESVGDTDNGRPARLQDPEDLPQRRLALGEMLDGAHRVGGIERRRSEGQSPHVGDRGAQSPLSSAKFFTGPMHDRRRDVDAIGVRSRARRPAEDPGVLGFVPQVSLEDLQAVEVADVLLEQALFIPTVVGRRRGAAEIRELLADLGPEGAVLRHAGGRTPADPGRSSPSGESSPVAPRCGSVEHPGV